ncbi:flagellar hook-associated protein FlgK [Rhodoplanes elegans]|uniref:Flagellar hook-associated protein 1 n=1 Tax=Rhodoplanes elegans TaxID=29408 RepID=A0A327KTE8_9BRAD|nr:flagellar hook-associated protein FlgK [Rhodoplanes elegans]MBK5959263.1 flagellar hook-associated protein FlgK [Rhodoplanes elegans]RAI42190.1 flagellar hook-associated protein FlgK [Rhodoplanes elegans]
MLTRAFDTATAGLKATQFAMGSVSRNIANAGVAGYVKRTVTTVSGPGNAGVATSEIARSFEMSALTQMRLETSRAAFASAELALSSQIDKLFGAPGQSTSLDGRLNALTQACQGLASNPGSAPVRRSTVGAACVLADQVRSIADSMESFRKGVDGRLASDVSVANGLLTSIASLNVKVATATDTSSRADLLDRRDHQITQLASLLDVTPSTLADGSASLMTPSGVLLVDRGTAARLAVAARGSDTAIAASPQTRLGNRLTAVLPGGSEIELDQRGVRSGSIAAALDLGNRALPRAQRRLDDLAFGLSQSLTDKRVSAKASGTGFELTASDLTDLKPGNSIVISIETAGARSNVILVASAQASRAVDPSLTIDSNARAQTFRIPTAPASTQDFASSITAALGMVAPGLAATSNADGTVLVSGAGVRSVVATITQPTSARDFSASRLQLPLFVDGAAGTLITGSLDDGAQRLGLARRLAVNPLLIENPSPLAVRSDGTPDPARMGFVFDALTKSTQTFSSASGIGGTSAPHETTIVSFAQDVIAAEGDAATRAKTGDERQRVALAAAQGAYSRSAGVNLDEEMSRLITLQTAYAANARVLTAAREMLDTLLRS